MAPGRVYRNYTEDDDSFDLTDAALGQPRSLKPAAISEAIRPAESEASESDGQSQMHGQASDETHSVGLTSDDGITPYADSTVSGYHDSRVTYNPLENIGLPMSPADFKKQSASPKMVQDNTKVRLGVLDGNNDTKRPSQTAQIASPAQSQYRDNFDFEKSEEDSAPKFSKIETADADAMANSMPEFFSTSVFQVVLRNPAIAHQLLRFSQSRLCGEHMEFLARVSKYHQLLHQVTQNITALYEDFFANGAPKYVNVPQGVNEKVNKEIRNSTSSVVPALEEVFTAAQKEVERMIYGDIYPLFVSHQMTLSAAKALGGDRGKYAGLGDCFVLTDPLKADNPIMFVSDGFVKVTGHPRKDIIPRNCRFLQSGATDRMAIGRIKQAVEKGEECVELLLNQKKNGEPFWNLLYVTPLFGADGKLVFYLGGQINCSTTIHSTSDVLRILALSRDAEEDSRLKQRVPKPAPGPTKSFRRAFMGRSSSSAPAAVPGMESSLIGKMENLPLTSQFRAFYSAYSNVSYAVVLVYATADHAAVHCYQL